MRKAILLYNPLSGRRPKRRVADIEAALKVLHSSGLDATAAPTTSSAGTSEQARRAIADGCDTIFACGGDGTIHDVLQAVVGTQVALGIIPLGTANTLAHDLRIPLSAVPAAHAALVSRPQRVAAGRIAFQDFSDHSSFRYFTVTAGVGVDAHLFYKLNVLIKGRFGMLAYYLKATRLWLTHDMRTFEVKAAVGADDKSPDNQSQWEEVSQLLAVRITQFGGVLRELAPGASLVRNDLRLVLFKTQNRLLYLAYILRGLFGQQWAVPGIELVDTAKVTCAGPALIGNKSRIFVEADGELLGTLPAEISIVPDAFTLLVPPTSLLR
ncbi:MAG: diacylglycerol/lipid kinase family protein [Terriglobales bacterium]